MNGQWKKYIDAKYVTTIENPNFPNLTLIKQAKKKDFLFYYGIQKAAWKCKGQNNINMLYEDLRSKYLIRALEKQI